MMIDRATMLARLVAVAEADPRIVGLLDYGSSSEGRTDVWSDVDVSLFLREEAHATFVWGWKAWAAELGELLLAYVGGVGHPWAVYAAEPVPLRVDFNFYPISAVANVPTWPNATVSVAAIARYDATDGRLTTAAGRLVGQHLGPPDPATTFEQVCGDFWYYLLRTYGKLQRGERWGVRFDFGFMILGNLMALLRLEAGAVDRWRASDAATGIERVLPPERLAQLDACTPDTSPEGVAYALRQAALLGREVCAVVAMREGWAWPRALADRIVGLLD